MTNLSAKKSPGFIVETGELHAEIQPRHSGINSVFSGWAWQYAQAELFSVP